MDLKHKLPVSYVWKFVFGIVVVDVVWLIGRYMFNRKLPPPPPSAKPKPNLHELPQEIVQLESTDLADGLHSLESSAQSILSVDTIPSAEEVNSLEASVQPIIFSDIRLDSPINAPTTPLSDHSGASFGLLIDDNDPRQEAFADSPYSVISSNSVPPLGTEATPSPPPTLQQKMLDNMLALRRKLNLF